MQLSFVDKVIGSFVPHLAPPATAVPVAPVAAPAATAIPTAGTAAAPAVPTTVAALAQPVEDAGFAAQLLGKVGGAQEKFLANQQLLGQVTSLLGARISQAGSNVLRLLRGEAPGELNG